MRTQAEKAVAFQKLHERDQAFLIPNPWDVGSARLLETLGFEALATTSAGFAFSQGRRDGAMGREKVIEHARTMAAATDLPMNADLENGFGDEPETVAETIRQATDTGLAGGSIEDSTGRSDEPIYELSAAVERIRAAAEVVHALPYPFMLTGRAENYLHGRADLADTIRRLQAYQEAGANVLFAPGLARREDIAAVVKSVDRPVNVLAGVRGWSLTLAELSEIGVKRVSVGGSLARMAYGAFLRGARELREHGTFGYAKEAIDSRELNRMFGQD